LPPVPQALSPVPVTHLPLLSQQPVGQVLESHFAVTVSHLLLLQKSPVVHLTQLPPALPQADSWLPATHFPELSQQPVGHVLGLQATATQAWF